MFPEHLLQLFREEAGGCVNCGSQDWGEVSLPEKSLLRQASFTLDGAGVACQECKCLFVPTSIVDAEGRLQKLADLNLVRASSFKRACIFSLPPPPSTHVYHVVVGPEFLNQSGASVLGSLIMLVVTSTFLARETKQLLDIGVDGYHNDPRPLWEIPEVCNWFFQIHEQLPYLPFWLTTESFKIYLMAASAGASEQFIAELASRLPTDWSEREFLLGKSSLERRQRKAVTLSTLVLDGYSFVDRVFGKYPEALDRVVSSGNARIRGAVEQ